MVTQTVFKTGIEKVIFTTPVLLIGLVISALSLWGLARLTRRERDTAAAADAAVSKRTGWLAQGWPLLAAGVIVLAFYVSEVIYSRSPELTAKPLQVSVVAWEAEHTWQYEVRNVLEEVVGEGECSLTAGEPVGMTCSSEVEAYEAKKGNSFFQSSGGRRVDRAHWRASGGQALDGSTALDLVGGYQSTRSWALQTDGFAIQVEDENAPEPSLSMPLNETPLAGNASLLATTEYFWPWQLAGLKLEQDANGRVVIFNPFTWREKTRDNGPQAKAEIVNVVGIENVDTPAGSFSAWRVDMGTRATAWYDTADPRRVVKFFNGVETWYLK